MTFEHEFFLRNSESFPFMRKLSLINCQPQSHKQSSKSMNDIHNLSIIKYSYLIELNIYEVHDDYIEQFLCNSKAYLRNNIQLSINFESLQRVTHHFTRDSTRINCAKINNISLYGQENYSIKSLQHYFPSAKIR